MKKFIEQKKEAEEQIHHILTDFKNNTGVEINYVDFSVKKKTGFNSAEEYETKIKILND